MSAAVARPVPEEEVVELLDSDDDAACPTNNRGGQAGPTQQPAAGRAAAARRRPRLDPSPVAAQRPAAARGPAEVIDLTTSPDVEIVSTTPGGTRQKGVKRRRFSGQQAGKSALALLALQQQQRAPPPPPSPEPPGPKCGICLEPMGGNSGRAMFAGSCGHVYCKECLTESVRVHKKCPTCRKSLQMRQLHQVFVNF